MNIGTSADSQGLPRVTWTQKMPAGTFGEQLASGFAMGGFIAGLVAGGYFGWGQPFTTLLLYIGGGGVLGAIGGIALMGMGMSKNPNERDRQDLQTAVLKDVNANAAIVRSGDSYNFTWHSGDSHGTVPLDSFDAFAHGTAAEWFGNSTEADRYHNMHVIIMQASGHGVYCIAAHAGGKADILHLHDVLSRTFILGRRNFMPKAPARSSATSRRSKRSNSDLPDNL